MTEMGSVKGYSRWILLYSTSVLLFSKWRASYAWDSKLLARAASVRKKLSINGFPSVEELSFPSAYEKPDGSGMRGFCNWIIPRHIMVGQYPGQNPEIIGPSSDDVRSHLEILIQDDNVGINLFCSLQSEIPPQEDYEAWKPHGEIYLDDARVRQRFPRPFTHYGPFVKQINPDCQLWHAPIEDLSVPSSKSLQELLLKLLVAMDEEDRCIYIHCWGGRGRAGLVGSCLLSLLFPEEDATTILDLIQGGYNTRAGAENMPFALSKSPQTDSQRAFVRAFVKERQRQSVKT